MTWAADFAWAAAMARIAGSSMVSADRARPIERDAADRRPRLVQDAVPGVETLQLGLLEIGMHFDLVDRRNDVHLRAGAGRARGHEVADPDGPHPPVRQQGLQGAIRIERQVELSPQWLVQKQQVNPLDTELPGTLVEPVQRLVVAVVVDPELGLDEDLVPGQAGTRNALADFALIAVRGGRIDVPVALGESRLNGASVLPAGSGTRRARSPAGLRCC